MTDGTGYLVSDVAKIVNGRCIGVPRPGQAIGFLLIDSRKLLWPAHTLFFALKSKQNDGHRYIKELLQKGVRSFVVEKVPENPSSEYPGACFIRVDSTLSALQALAAEHRSRFSYPVVALTGSNGKTVIKEWLYQSLCEKHHIARNPKSYNSQIGVPLSVWLMTGQHEMGVFEAGISQPGEMQKLRKILQPGTGIFTNIGPAHDEGFASRKEKIREKLQLFTRCHTLIYCSDYRAIQKEILDWHHEHASVRLLSWGRDRQADMQVAGKERAGNSTLVSVVYGGDRMMLSIPFQDYASVENALHVAAFMKHAGYGDAYIIRKIAALQPVAMRLEMKEGVNNSTIVNDSYNSDLHSLAIALDFLGSQTPEKKKTLVLSDILQSGIPAEALYTEVASLAKSRNIERLIGIGPGISSQEDKFIMPAAFYKDTDDFIANADFSSFRNEAILLKGARVFGFERISNLLQQKDHQTILEIDLDGLTHNMNVFRSILTPGVKVMGMVKAFSYGTGSVEVARMLQYHHVDYLAVAYADEGKTLRQGGVHVPIVVMNPEVRSFDTLLSYGLEPEIYGFPLLQRFMEAIDKLPGGQRQQPFPVHVKLDTGMHRLGFMANQVADLASVLKNNPHIRVASVFSHLAASEDGSQDPFTKKQIALFEELCHALEGALGHPFLRHICNSAAISRFPEAHYEMVRLGIGLYGVSGDPDVQPLLRHVSSFRSVVSQVKHLSEGDTVGYNRAGVAGKDMVVAIVPVGYADGLDRRLSNGRGKLMVNGEKAPIAGNISMDMCAIDVTGVEVKEGDEVIVFGSEMPVTEMARDLDTIPYEVFTSVSQRVKRVYYQE